MTTTCEALWMGVPVVTLAGGSRAGRVGVSILSAVGLEEFIAETADAYVEIAARLAADKARMAELKASIRGRMAGLRPVRCGSHGARRRGRLPHDLAQLVRWGMRGALRQCFT